MDREDWLAQKRAEVAAMQDLVSRLAKTVPVVRPVRQPNWEALGLGSQHEAEGRN